MKIAELHMELPSSKVALLRLVVFEVVEGYKHWVSLLGDLNGYKTNILSLRSAVGKLY